MSASARSDSTIPTQPALKVVLYVEDDPGNISLMQQILECIRTVEIEMIPAHNAELEIKLALERRPDLILMDIIRPRSATMRRYGS